MNFMVRIRLRYIRKYGFTDNKRVFNVGTSLEYEQVFKRIITELQRCQDNYEEMLMLLLRHLLIIFNRKITTEHVIRNEFLDSQMDTAITYFNTNYNRSINVEEYASSIGMSISWFIRSFRKYTGNTPVQFLTALRMTNAQVLLETTSYSINEIAGIGAVCLVISSHSVSILIPHSCGTRYCVRLRSPIS